MIRREHAEEAFWLAAKIAAMAIGYWLGTIVVAFVEAPPS